MRAVAERLRIAGAAAAQPGGLHARHDAPRAAGDLEVAAYAQRPVGFRIHRERAIAYRQHVGLAARGLAARGEAHLMMRAVAEGFVLRRATATQRRAETDRRAIQPQVAADRVRSAFANGE